MLSGKATEDASGAFKSLTTQSLEIYRLLPSGFPKLTNLDSQDTWAVSRVNELSSSWRTSACSGSLSCSAVLHSPLKTLTGDLAKLPSTNGCVSSHGKPQGLKRSTKVVLFFFFFQSVYTYFQPRPEAREPGQSQPSPLGSIDCRNTVSSDFTSIIKVFPQVHLESHTVSPGAKSRRKRASFLSMHWV